MQPLQPSDVAVVWQLLKHALSHTAEERKQGESGLADLALRENFCSCLVEVIASGDVDESSRWLAALQLKNTVARHWACRSPRDASAQTLTDAERSHLRSQMTNVMFLRDNKAALQIAVALSKMARHDYPQHWPTLFDDITKALSENTQDPLKAKRTFLVMHHVLKELASKRLMQDRKRFQEITGHMLPYMWSHWWEGAQAVNALLPAGLGASNSSACSALESKLEVWMLSTKIVRRLLAAGVPRDGDTLEPSAHVTQALPAVLQMLDALLHRRHASPAAANRCHAMLDCALLKLCKVLSTLVDVHPWAFHTARVLIPALTLFVGIICDADKRGTFWTRLVTRAMRFVTLVIQSPYYQHKTQLVSLVVPRGAALEERDALWLRQCGEVQQALASFWQSEQRQRQLLQGIIDVRLPLTHADLLEWQEDAETWYHVHEGVASEDDARGVTHILLQELVRSNESELCAMIAEGLRGAAASVPAQVLAQPQMDKATQLALLRKEAVYNCASVLAYELFDFVNFKDWAEGSLLQELSIATQHNKPLQRRIMRLIAEWVASISKADRPVYYSAVVARLTQPPLDMCLQLVAVDTLRVLVEDWDFEEEPFVPFLQPVLGHMPCLLQECMSFDSHTLIFTLVSSIVERMGDLVQPHAATILSWLPAVWQNSEGQGLLRMQVLTLLQRMVNALGGSSPATYPFVLPVLNFALDPAGPEAVNLVEDALLLWLVVLRNAPAGSADALGLWPHWQQIMATGIEHVPTCMQIATSCILLGGLPFLQNHGAAFAETLAGVVADVNSRALLAVYVPMGQLLQLYGHEAAQLLQKPLLRLMNMLFLGEEERPSWVKGVCVLARVLLHSPQAFFDLFDAAAAQGARFVARGSTFDGTPPAASGSALIAAFLSDWLDNFDAIGQPLDRKLCALALANLLAAPVPGVLERLDLLLAAVTSVWLDAEGGADGGGAAYGYDLFAAGDDDGPGPLIEANVLQSEDAEGELVRRRSLYEADPVKTAIISQWVKEKMAHAQHAHGHALSAAISQLPSSITEPLRNMMA